MAGKKINNKTYWQYIHNVKREGLETLPCAYKRLKFNVHHYHLFKGPVVSAYLLYFKPDCRAALPAIE